MQKRAFEISKKKKKEKKRKIGQNYKKCSNFCRKFGNFLDISVFHLAASNPLKQLKKMERMMLQEKTFFPAFFKFQIFKNKMKNCSKKRDR